MFAQLALPVFLLASINNHAVSPHGLTDETKLPPRQKLMAVMPVMKKTSDCLVAKVKASPELQNALKQPYGVGNLLVVSMHSCLPEVRALIGAYDIYYGEGAGETFFMGPFLDMVTTTVVREVSARAR